MEPRVGQEVVKCFSNNCVFNARQYLPIQCRLLPAEANRIIVFPLLASDPEACIYIAILIFKIVTERVVQLIVFTAAIVVVVGYFF